ncbi:LOW QUALITY PROTEIN: hypothetical protein QC762_704890 [Podospora pseudocomata]|uniref:Uncharacterized protein n=1 Tax=Podospora pseudocomata TaxID=2093779 RepID=A0ABR0G282_9PEZI|nr:LOW QUALITY PROTEIN: hypothetical protein QC762_704890 [Podospora pseudocomata]
MAAASCFLATLTPLPAPTTDRTDIAPLRAMLRWQYDNKTMTTTSGAATTAMTIAITTDDNHSCTPTVPVNLHATVLMPRNRASMASLPAAQQVITGLGFASSSTDHCNCNNGIQYLECVSVALATSSCCGAVGGEPNQEAYEQSWFQTACPTPPSSVMAQLPQLSTVQLELSPVSTIIPRGPITAPPLPVAPSIIPGEGAPLLEGDCTATSFSMIQRDDKVFYVPFIGCDNSRPECCPFSVRTVAVADGSKQQANRMAAVPGQFPQPQSGDTAKLVKCPMDYYRVPGGLCCSNCYFKYTSTLASVTPFFSSLIEKASPPVITAGDAKNPANSDLPTPAILMRIGVSQAGGSNGLSPGAVVGIAVGVGMLVLFRALVAFALVSHKKKKREAQSFISPTVAPGGGGMAYQSGYHAPPGSPPPASTASPAGSPGAKYAGMVSLQYGPSAEQEDGKSNDLFIRLSLRMGMAGNNIQFIMGTHINGNGNVNNTSNKGTLMNHIVDTN